MSDAGTLLTPAELLSRIPQQPPFRFIDDIVSVDAERIVARYRWRPEADFYRGHFPGNPVTPGVLLLESMAQAGLVALGIYLLWKEMRPEEAEKLVTVFVDANVEFTGRVLPGDRVETTGRRIYFRRNKLRSEVEMRLESGAVVASGTISGMGVPR
jgi:3-hydroxyacyl-[acyl-carrier-protein] dehydratase